MIGALKRTEGIHRVVADVPTHQVTVTYDKNRWTPAGLTDRLAEIGYDVEPALEDGAR